MKFSWQCFAVGLIALCVPSLMALQSLQDYADQVVESQKMAATPGAEDADAGQWHHLTIADLICYSRRYDDIREDVGMNPTALLQHYLSTGIRERRDPRCRDGEIPLGEEGSAVRAGAGPSGSVSHSMDQDTFSLLEEAYGKNRALQLYNAAGGPRTRRSKNTRANGGAPIGSRLVVTPDEYSVSGMAPDQDDTPVDKQGEAMYDAFGPLRAQMGAGAASDGGRGSGEIIDMGNLMAGGDESELEWPEEAQQRTQFMPSASSLFKGRSKKRKPKGGGGGVSARTRKKQQGGEMADTEPAGNMGDVILDKSQTFQCPPNKIMQGKTCQPAFLVVGAQKSGTSTLAHLMGQHPQVKKPQSKEILFFNWNNDFKIKCNPPVKELQAYFKKFPMVTPELHRKSGIVTGEWSATYLPCHCCPKTVFSAMPQTKIIAILRHPIDRAHSRFVEQTYFAKKYKKQEINNCPVWMGWDRFVDHSIRQIGKCMASIPGPKASNVRECIHHHNELGWSIYAPSLQEWIAQFGVGGVQVVYTHDLQRDPEKVLMTIERHVGIGQYTKYKNVNTTMNAEGKYGWIRKDNEASHDDPRSKMSKPTYEKLFKFYAPSMVELQRMAQKGLISKLPAAWVQEWRL